MANSAEQPNCQIKKKKEPKERKKEKGNNVSYQKRAGTSGIRGQLYETKILSLIYFKTIHDEDTEEFHLATNVDEIGMFDDICLRAKVKGNKKPIAVFVQAKHRENDKLLKLSSKKDLASCFDSYLKIKKRFQEKKDGVLFKGEFNETDCIFVMYTTAKDDGYSKTCDDDKIKYLNNIISTGNPASQPWYTNEDLVLLRQQVLEEQLKTLAQKVAKNIVDDVKSLMNDELELQYHVILARNVFDISEIKPEGHRMASFRDDFFRQSQEFIQIFKDALCSDVVEARKIDIKNESQELLTRFLSDPDDRENLCRLIRGGIVTFKTGKLEFRDKMIPQNYKQELDSINNYKKEVRDEAIEQAVKECHPSLEFKVPAVFGNNDLSIRGDDVKINKRLDHLCKKLKEWMDKSKPSNIVAIDESIDEGLLRLNGGLSSAIGNIFIFDDTSKLFKFCENCESLGDIAKRFFTKLESQIENMHDYKFDMRAKIFPKLSLEQSSKYEEDIVKDFCSKLVFYTSQGDEHDVEKKIKDEIKKLQVGFRNPEKRSEAIFLKYHDEIQRWWMRPKDGSYLTKDGKLYKDAVDNACVVNVMPDIKFAQRVFCVENGRLVTSYDPTEKRDADNDNGNAEKDNANADNDNGNADNDNGNADNDNANADNDNKNADNDKSSAGKDIENADNDKSNADNDKSNVDNGNENTDNDKESKKKVPTFVTRVISH